MSAYIAAVLAAVIAVLAATSANAASYTFVQGGFPDGGVLTGSFEAVEFVADGQFRLDDGEITQFQASFSGFASFPAMSQGGLIDFSWTFASGNLLGDQASETIRWSEGLYAYVAGGPSFSCNGTDDCGSVQVGPANDETVDLVTITRTPPVVPLPASGVMLAMGVGALVVARRKARK